MSARRLFGDASAEPGAVIELDQEARRHAKVLRLRPGSILELFDGEGHLAQAELLDAGRARIERRWAAEPTLPHLTLVWALPKKSAVDAGIRMATELGVDVIRPALSERAQQGPASSRLDRWRRIAREATRQSERATTPRIDEPRPLATAAQVDAELRLAAYARDGRFGSLAPSASVAIAIGPEGGFTDAERETLSALGYQALALGPHVLRSETAVAAALALAAYRGGPMRSST